MALHNKVYEHAGYSEYKSYEQYFVLQRAESEYERFQRLQNDLLKKDPSTAAFYHAQLRTEKRVCNFIHRMLTGTVHSEGFPS
jgi:hypothetical protein